MYRIRRQLFQIHPLDQMDAAVHEHSDVHCVLPIRYWLWLRARGVAAEHGHALLIEPECGIQTDSGLTGQEGSVVHTVLAHLARMYQHGVSGYEAGALAGNCSFQVRHSDLVVVGDAPDSLISSY